MNADRAKERATRKCEFAKSRNLTPRFEFQCGKIILTDRGIQIDSRDEQSSNSDLPNIETLLPRSNVTLKRLAQSSKQQSEIVSIDEGIQIDRNDERFSKADSPRIETLQPAANVTDEIESQRLKHPAEIVSMSLETVTVASSPK
jgi:hypothetical protein